MVSRNNTGVSVLVPKRWFLILCALWMHTMVWAQPTNSVNFRISDGYILPHGTSMWHLIQGHVTTYELSYVSQTDGSKDWHHVLHYPRQGFAVYHASKGMPIEIGSLTSAYGFLDFPIWQSKRWGYFFKFGAGVSFAENSFDRVDNYRSVAMGSPFNLGFIFANHIEYKSDKITLVTGVSLIHASSGAYRMPNLGVNIPSVDFKLGIIIQEGDKNERPESFVYDHNIKAQFLLSSGLRAVDPVTNEKFFIRTLQLEAVKGLGPVVLGCLGVDVFYNKAIAKLDDLVYADKPLLQLGTKLGVDLKLDRASIFAQMGVYVKNESKYHGDFYHRFGGRYLLKDHLLLSFALKTHFAKADNFEIGIGYRL